MRLAVLFTILAACGDRTQPESTTVTAARLERGGAVAGQLKKTLLAELSTAMGRGPASAIEVCSARAPAIAAELTKDGVKVGRATRRPRNGANAATGWTLDAIAHFEAIHARGEPLKAAKFSRVLPDGRVGYAEPLVIQDLCTVCHGKTPAPEVTAALASRYPDDQATGYAVGDLRGVVWVELP